MSAQMYVCVVTKHSDDDLTTLQLVLFELATGAGLGRGAALQASRLLQGACDA